VAAGSRLPLLILLLTSPALADWQEPEPLVDEPGLAELASDRTWRGEGHLGRFVIYSSPAGHRRMQITPLIGGAYSDRGRWRIDDDQLCQSWDRTLRGMTYCITIAPDGDAYRAFNPDGSLHATFTVERGNPEGM
jgi:hypothetical protein